MRAFNTSGPVFADRHYCVPPLDRVDPGGGPNLVKPMEAFQAFFRAHSERWIERFSHREAGPQSLLQAFLQRIVNDGGRIEREYGAGRGRVDPLIARPWPEEAGGRGARNHVVECKSLRGKFETAVRDGAAQTARYMDRCGAAEGHPAAFDRGEGDWAEKIFHRAERAPGPGGPPVHVRGMQRRYPGAGLTREAAERIGRRGTGRGGGAGRWKRRRAAGRSLSAMRNGGGGLRGNSTR